MKKTCRRCRTEKLLIEDFYTDKSKRDGRRPYCKECCGAIAKNWAKSNPDKAKAGGVRWAKENPEAHKAKTAEWRRLNPDHKTRSNANSTRWQKDNPERCRASSSKRRAFKLAYRGPHYTPSDVASLLVDQHGLCAYCGGSLEAYHVDHIVPLSRGGGNGADNICLACPTCNMSKGNRLFLLEWSMKEVARCPL